MYSYTVVMFSVVLFGSSNSQRFQPNIWTVDTAPTENVNVSGMTFFHTRAGGDTKSLWGSGTSDNANTYTSFLSSQSESREVDAIPDSSSPGESVRLQLPFPTFSTPTIPGDTPTGQLPEPVVPSEPINSVFTNVGNNLIEGGSTSFDLGRTNDKPAFDLSKFGILENNVPDDGTNGLNSYNTLSSGLSAPDSKPGKDQPNKPFPFSQIDGNTPPKRKGPSMIASGSFKDHSKLPVFKVQTEFVDHSMLKMPEDKFEKKLPIAMDTVTTSTNPPTVPPPTKSRGLALPGVMEGGVFKSKQNKVLDDHKLLKTTNGEVENNKARVLNPVVLTTTPKPVTPSDRLIVDDLYPDVSFSDNSVNTDGNIQTDGDTQISLNSKDVPTTSSIGKLLATGKGSSKSSGRTREDLADTEVTSIPERASEFYPRTPWGDTIILPTPDTQANNAISDPKLTVPNDKNINNTPSTSQTRGQDIMTSFSSLNSNSNSIQNTFGQNSVTTNNIVPMSNDITSNSGNAPVNPVFDLTQPLTSQNGATNGFNSQSVGVLSPGQINPISSGQNVFNSGQMSGNNNQGVLSSSQSNQNAASPSGIGLVSSMGTVSSNAGATSTTFQQATINGLQNVPQTVVNGNQLSSNNQMRPNGQMNFINENIFNANTPMTGQSPNNINNAQTTLTRGNINSQQFSGQFNNANVPQTMFNGQLNGGSGIISNGQQLVSNGQQGTANVQQTPFNRQQIVPNGSPQTSMNGQASNSMNGQQTTFNGQGMGAINTAPSGQQINSNIQTSQNNGQVLSNVPQSFPGLNVLTNGFQRAPGQQQIGGTIQVLNGQGVNGQANTINRVRTTFNQQGNGQPGIPQSQAGTSVQQMNTLGQSVNINIPQSSGVNQQNVVQNQGINNNNQPQNINGFQSINGQQVFQNSQQAGTNDGRFNSNTQQSLLNGPNGQQQFTNRQQLNVIGQPSLTNGQQTNTNVQQTFTNGQQLNTKSQTFTNGQQLNTNAQKPFINGQQLNTNGQQPFTNGQQRNTNGQNQMANGQLNANGQRFNMNGQQLNTINQPLTDANGRQIAVNNILTNTNNQLLTNNGQQIPINSLQVNTNNRLPTNNGQQIPLNSLQVNTNNRLPTNNGHQIPLNSLPINTNNQIPTNNGQQIPINSLPVNRNNQIPTNNGQQIPINRTPVNTNNQLPTNNGQQIPINRIPLNTNNHIPINNGQQIPINRLPVNTNNQLPTNNGQQIPVNRIPLITNNLPQTGSNQQIGGDMFSGTNVGVRTTQVQNGLNSNAGQSMMTVPQGINNNQRFGNGLVPSSGQNNVPGSLLNAQSGRSINGGNPTSIQINPFNQQPVRGGPVFPTINNGQRQPILPQVNGLNGRNNNVQGNQRMFQQMRNSPNTPRNPNGIQPPQVSPINSQNAFQNRLINGNMRGVPTNMQNLVRNRNMQMNRGPGQFTGNPGFPFNGVDFFQGQMMPFR